MTITRLDVQTARIVVGNVLSGDDAADCDFLDTGNGAAVSAAIAAATGTTADVYIKSGTYDFSLPGAPGVLTVPVNMRVVGAGRTSPSTAPYTGTTFVLTGTQRQLMTVGARSVISDFTVILPAATPGAAGTEVIEFFAGAGQAHCVQVDFTGAPGNVDESLAIVFHLRTGDSVRDCKVLASAGYTTVGGGLRGFHLLNDAQALDCEVDGLDLGFWAMTGNSQIQFVSCRAVDNAVFGFRIDADDTILSACRAVRAATGGGFRFAGDRITLQASIADGTGVAGTTGVELLGRDCTVDGCVVVNNMSAGIADTGVSNIVGASNVYDGNAVDVVNVGSTTSRRVIPTSLPGIATPPGPIAALPGQIIQYDTSGAVLTIDAPPPGTVAIGDWFVVKDVFGGPFAATVDGGGNLMEAIGGGAFAPTQVMPIGAFVGVKWIFEGGVWLIPVT